VTLKIIVSTPISKNEKGIAIQRSQRMSEMRAVQQVNAASPNSNMPCPKGGSEKARIIIVSQRKNFRSGATPYQRLW